MPRFNMLAGWNSSDGFIVVAVLWIVAALATLAMIQAVYVKAAASALADYDVPLQRQELAMAGIELAVYRLTVNPQAPPAQGQLKFRLGHGDVAVSYRPENGLIDLNFAPKPLLAGLFAVLGAGRDDADGYADRIIAWRTPAASAAADTEEMVYRMAGKNYGPRRGAFQHLNELGLVAGLPPDLISRAVKYLTVYSGQPEINVSNAAPEVVAALPGSTPERTAILLTQREGAPQDVLNSRLGTAGRYVTMNSGKTNHVTVDVQFDGRRRARTEAVVLLLDGDAAPFRVLSWRDEDGEPSGAEHPGALMR